MKILNAATAARLSSYLHELPLRRVAPCGYDVGVALWPCRRLQLRPQARRVMEFALRVCEG